MNNKNTEENNNNGKKQNSSMLYIILAFLFLYAFTSTKNFMTTDEITYNKFLSMIQEDQVESVIISSGEIKILPKEDENEKSNRRKVLYTGNVDDPNLINLLNEAGVDYKAEPIQSNFMSDFIFNWVIMPLILFSIFRFVFGRLGKKMSMGGPMMGMGKSNAKVYKENDIKITFNDVAGQDEAKESLKEIIDYLNHAEKYIDIGAKLPKGALLVGPPGTGKTLLAKAIAGEAGVPFYSISGSDFVEMFVGVGASRVRDLFEQAKKSAPSLVFIDEIDAVGRQRGAGLGGGHDEREQTLNQLLVEMDGFGANEGIIMIAATNRPDILDPALLRPGRFDRQIVVGAPDVKGREEILKVHTKKKPLAEDVDLKVLAKRTPGFSGADLENLANEAALLSVRRNEKLIGMLEFEEAITRVIAGPEKKSRVMSEHDKRLTAYHEGGHAVVMNLLEHADPVHEISIIPRGMAGGYTMHLPNEDRSYTSKEKLKDDMVGLLGGRVAEKLILSDISTGAKNDIDRASAIARAMVMEYGMSEKLGTISYNSDNNEVFLGKNLGHGRNFSEEVGAEIDKEVKKFIDEAYNRAEELLSQNINKLHAVAAALLEKEKIDGEEFQRIFSEN